MRPTTLSRAGRTGIPCDDNCVREGGPRGALCALRALAALGARGPLNSSGPLETLCSLGPGRTLGAVRTL